MHKSSIGYNLVLPMVAQLQLKLINKTKIYIMKKSNDETFNATIGNTVLGEVPSEYKEYVCTDCQTKNIKKDNRKITVGFCDNCEHPLWNSQDDVPFDNIDDAR